MTKREISMGWIWLAVQMLLLPSLVTGLAAPLGSAAVNCIYHLISVLAVTVIFRRYLKAQLHSFRGSRKRAILTAAAALAVYYGAEALLSWVIVRIDPGFSNVNDDSVAALRQGNLALTALMTVVLAPVSEELLFRGLIFGAARRVSPWAAYLVSAAAFAALHVAGYIGSFTALRLALCFLQYLPAGLLLAAAMEKTGSIFTAMAMHGIINAISMLGIV